jgi:hypothetical protein
MNGLSWLLYFAEVSENISGALGGSVDPKRNHRRGVLASSHHRPCRRSVEEFL